MSRTVTALYDSRSEAESAKQRLQSAVDTDSVRIIDQSSGDGSSGGGFLGSSAISHEDRHSYNEGINRGGFMLCAEVDSDEDADKIVRVLEESSAVDMDERQQNWQSEGWQPYSANQQSGSFQQSAASFGSSSDRTDFDSQNRTSETGERTVEEERIPIVEESLSVGKRQVERGGARVRSYVRETPVSEQVNLREEHVNVERLPVTDTGTLSSADLNRGELLQDREIEMRATAEEAVVGKEAHVTEEVIVSKTAGERTENVQDTVRHTEVDVDEGITSTDRTSSDRGAFFDDDNRRS